MKLLSGHKIVVGAETGCGVSRSGIWIYSALAYNGKKEHTIRFVIVFLLLEFHLNVAARFCFFNLMLFLNVRAACDKLHLSNFFQPQQRFTESSQRILVIYIGRILLRTIDFRLLEKNI